MWWKENVFSTLSTKLQVIIGLILMWAHVIHWRHSLTPPEPIKQLIPSFKGHESSNYSYICKSVPWSPYCKYISAHETDIVVFCGYKTKVEKHTLSEWDFQIPILCQSANLIFEHCRKLAVVCRGKYILLHWTFISTLNNDNKLISSIICPFHFIQCRGK